MVVTILKNDGVRQWEGFSHIWWTTKHVWNHQPVYIYTLGDPGSPMTAHRLLLRCRWSRCIMLRDRAGWGGGWGGVGCIIVRGMLITLLMLRCRWSRCIMLRDRAGWGGGWGVGWGVLSFVKSWYKLITLLMLRCRWSRCIMLRDRPGWGGLGWGVLSFVKSWSRCWCSAADDHVADTYVHIYVWGIKKIWIANVGPGRVI